MSTPAEQSINSITMRILEDLLSDYFRTKLGESLVTRGGIRARPDGMFIDAMGITVIVEAKVGHEKGEEVKRDCNKRLEEGIADLCIAIAYHKEVRAARSLSEAEEKLKELEHVVSIVAPLETLDLGRLKLPDLAQILEKRSIYESLLEREVVEEIAKEIMKVLQLVSDLDGRLLESLAKIAEEALELREEGTSDEAKAKSLLFMITNAMIVHEALASTGAVPGLPPLRAIDRGDPAGWLAEQWERIREVNYEQVFEIVRKAVKVLPPHHAVSSILLELSRRASQAVAKKAIFRHDLAGRLYHRLLLRKLAKGLGTFYTSIPASVILSSLALDLLKVEWGSVEEVRKLRVGDLACGSGTLLSAVYGDVMSRFIASAPQHAGQQLGELHRALLEEVLYGFDVLEHAVHLTAASLVMRRPSVAVSHTNTYVVPLGVVEGEAFLGSLSLEVSQGKVKFPRVKTPFGEDSVSATKATAQRASAEGLVMDPFDLVIMNPPFVRSGHAGRGVLFGHLPEAQRREVLEKLARLGRSMRLSLGLSTGFGSAGLGTYFTLLAYKVLREEGVAALVLPRTFLSGTDWAPVREFLMRRGSLPYLIISDDPAAKWAWSENTGLSEVLLVYKKARGRDRTAVAYVRKFPKSSTAAEMYAKAIKSVAQSLEPAPLGFSRTEAIAIKERGQPVPAVYVYSVEREVMERAAHVAGNLNVAVGFHDSFLSAAAFELFFNKRLLLSLSQPQHSPPAPLVPLSQYVSARHSEGWEEVTGYDSRIFREICVKGDRTARSLWNLNRDALSSLALPEGVLRTMSTNERCLRRAGRLLVAGLGRVGLQSVGTVVLFYKEPLISPLAWSVPLHPSPKEDEEIAKLQALWLTSTPGLLHFLSLRQDSSGSYLHFVKSSLPKLLLVDEQRLSPSAMSAFLRFFDEKSRLRLGTFREQLRAARRGEGFRYELDKLVLKELFGMDVEGEREAHDWLAQVYVKLLEETLI
ncbi:MAG: hypothetical protein N3D79_01595 [Acidilobaceae archaeon]|nr:hypothetical protein [Acidilobaceae archaeon]